MWVTSKGLSLSPIPWNCAILSNFRCISSITLSPDDAAASKRMTPSRQAMYEQPQERTGQDNRIVLPHCVWDCEIFQTIVLSHTTLDLINAIITHLSSPAQCLSPFDVIWCPLPRPVRARQNDRWLTGTAGLINLFSIFDCTLSTESDALIRVMILCPFHGSLPLSQFNVLWATVFSRRAPFSYV